MPAWLYPLCVFTISTSLAAHVAIQHAELVVERERHATQLGALQRLVRQARDGAEGRSARLTAEQVHRELALVGLRDRPGVAKAGGASGVSWMDVLRPSKRAERQGQHRSVSHSLTAGSCETDMTCTRRNSDNFSPRRSPARQLPFNAGVAYRGASYHGNSPGPRSGMWGCP